VAKALEELLWLDMQASTPRLCLSEFLHSWCLVEIAQCAQYYMRSCAVFSQGEAQALVDGCVVAEDPTVGANHLAVAAHPALARASHASPIPKL
jgi:hypothetical protein